MSFRRVSRDYNYLQQFVDYVLLLIIHVSNILFRYHTKKSFKFRWKIYIKTS